MKTLWAPWRMEYIRSSKKEKGCFICKAVKEGPSPNNLLLTVRENALVIMNRFPYNTGHLMVAPLSHKGELSQLMESEMLGLMKLTEECIRVLKKAMKPEGFNVGINLGKVAGAGLEGHLHIHIVPRWQGDTNFMPVIGETKVIPASLEGIYSVLSKYFNGKEK